MAAADAAEAVIAQMPVEPLPIAAEAVVEPPPIAAEAVVEPPPIAEEAVVEPLPNVTEAVVEPPPIVAETFPEPPRAAADDATAPMPVVPPPPPPLEQKVIESIKVQLPSLADDRKPCDMVTDMKEIETNHCPLVLPSSDSGYYPNIIQKQPEETIHHQHLLVEEQPAMVVSDNNNEESEKEAPTQPCSSDEQQKPMLGCVENEQSQDISPMSSSMISIHNCLPSSADILNIGDLSDDSPTRDSNDDSDHRDGGCHYDPIYDPIHGPIYDPIYGPIYDPTHDPMYRWRDPYSRFFHRRERRNRWPNDNPFIPGFRNSCNPMSSRDTEPWGCWPSPEPDHGKKRYNVTSSNTRHVSRWSSPEPDCGMERYTVGAGLYNPCFWTCFLNCILQCMVHTVPLVLRIRKADHPDPCPRASAGFCCFCSLKLLADESIRRSGSALYPESFVNHLKSISSNFESGVQQDAQEFLCDLLEKLDEASVASRSLLEEPSSKEEEEGGIAKEIFGGRLKSQLHCPECNRCSDKSEPFLDLSLEVTMVESLMDALQSFTKVELIEDFMCDGCKSRVNMEKHLKVEQAPEVLVIHLKRFTNSGGKIWDKVKYPIELDINSFTSSSDDTLQKYDLYGVVVHHGAYGRGHYVCYIRSSVDDWYEFNDDKIHRFSEASILDTAAYLLFYVKKGSSPWFSTLLEKEDGFPLDGSSLEEQGTREIALVNNKEEELTSSSGQDNSGYCLVGPAEENGCGPSLPDFSHSIQRNENGSTLWDPADKLEEGCLGGMSGGTQALSCLTGSGYENGHSDRFLEPWKKEDVIFTGSLDMKELSPCTHGSSEVDSTVTHGGSPPKSENICSLLQQSHKYDNCHRPNFSFQEDETGGCSGAPSMGMCTSENETVESKSNHELRDSKDGASTVGWEEGTTEKRKRPSSAYADGDGESKASRKRRRKHLAVASKVLRSV